MSRKFLYIFIIAVIGAFSVAGVCGQEKRKVVRRGGSIIILDQDTETVTAGKRRYKRKRGARRSNLLPYMEQSTIVKKARSRRSAVSTGARRAGTVSKRKN
ncbi:MAG: hypothetical protein JSS81_11810 [Acidobacteria bacterium]|nr:hypothetical protein [Acidobacteriota bacterium]